MSLVLKSVNYDTGTNYLTGACRRPRSRRVTDSRHGSSRVS